MATSSTEAEYISLATASTELIWINNILKDLNVIINKPIEIFKDNQSCIYSLNKWDQKRLKHLDVKYYFVKDLYQKGVINVLYIPSSQQKADILTKGLTAEQFVKLRSTFGLILYIS